MEIKKYCIDGKEYICVEKIKVGFLVLERCITTLGEKVYISCRKNKQKIVRNKILLNILNKMFNYETETDICESKDERGF